MSRSKARGIGFTMRSLLNKIDIPEDSIVFKELWKTEWSSDFEELQRHRLVMGALRYGKLNAPGKKQWDRIPDMIARLKRYKDTHNLEHLVDVANLCLLEFEEGKHPDRHFKAQDDTKHTEEI